MSNPKDYAAHYADIDDDEESTLGAAIFRDIVGLSVEEVLDDDNKRMIPLDPSQS